MSKLYETTVADIIHSMPERFRPEESGDANFVVGYECLGEGGGSWKVSVSKGAVTVKSVKGELKDCTTIVRASGANAFIGVILGKINPVEAQMAGTLKIEGDTNVLTTVLPRLFRPYTLPGEEGASETASAQPEELLMLSVVNSVGQRYATGPMMGKWFEGFKEKKFYASLCPKCGRTLIPPKEICSDCRVRCTEFVELGPKATLTQCEIAYYASPDPLTGRVRKTPYATIYMMLDGASDKDCFSMDRMKKEDMAKMKIGSRVQPVWADEPTGGFDDILYFELCD